MLDDLPEEVPSTHVDTKSLIINQLVHIDRLTTLHHHVVLLDHLQFLEEALVGTQFALLTEHVDIMFNK